jgi:uncharacterized lipoprotein
MSRKSILATAVLAMLVAGCSKNDEPVAPVPQPNPVVASPKAEANEATPGVTFDVTPSEFRLCDSDKGHIVAKVSWDARPAGIAYVNIMVSRAGSEPKLFITGKGSGEHDSGNWVQDGTEFILQNTATKQTLATRKVTGKGC